MNLTTFKNHWIRISVTFILIVTTLVTMYSVYYYNSTTWNKERALVIANNETNIIKDNMNLIFARDYTLRNLVVANNGSISGFDSTCENVFKEVSDCGGVFIKNIALAPNCKVEKIYPLEANEKLIGFDSMDKSKVGNKEAIESYKKGELIMTNPFSLVQGVSFIIISQSTLKF